MEYECWGTCVWGGGEHTPILMAWLWLYGRPLRGRGRVGMTRAVLLQTHKKRKI